MTFKISIMPGEKKEKTNNANYAKFKRTTLDYATRYVSRGRALPSVFVLVLCSLLSSMLLHIPLHLLMLALSFLQPMLTVLLAASQQGGQPR